MKKVFLMLAMLVLTQNVFAKSLRCEIAESGFDNIETTREVETTIENEVSTKNITLIEGMLTAMYIGGYLIIEGTDKNLYLNSVAVMASEVKGMAAHGNSLVKYYCEVK